MPVNMPDVYRSLLNEKDTELAIVRIKDFFQLALSTELNLTRVTAPLFIPKGTGVNDDLNGVEKPVSFRAKSIANQEMEIVHSLAKWKRLKVTELGLKPKFGIYADMNAIRADEDLDAVHSLYVDQWDWELVIDQKDRSTDFFQKIAQKIYHCIKRTEFFIYDNYPIITPTLPEHLTFIHAEELYQIYPYLTAKEREEVVARRYGAVFIIGIGYNMPDGLPHDGRAPDYDDWITDTMNGRHGLNGDLVVWHEPLGCALELSSMGIRVDPEAMKKQLEYRNCEERAELFFHRKLLAGELLQTAGGGIGQSRLCMFLLRKAHIGETQVSSWPRETIEDCAKRGVRLL